MRQKFLIKILNLACILFFAFSPLSAKDCDDLEADYIDKHQDVFGEFFKVLDASPFVHERPLGDLKVFRLSDVFSSTNEVFLGFGLPNVYLAVPDGKGGVIKFSGKMLKLAQATVDPIRLAQSGVLIRFKDVPPETVEKLRQGMMQEEGKRHWTCANATCKILDSAGFTSGGKDLDSFYIPSQLAGQIRTQGLELNGKSVEFDIIKTTPLGFQAFTLAMIKSELLTPQRQAMRALQPWLQQFGVSAVWAFAKNRVGGMALYLTGQRKPAAEVAQTKALLETLPGEQQYIDDINLSYSTPSKLGIMLRILWGRHSLYEARQTRVNVEQYLPTVLKEFPGEKPSFITNIWKNFLFSQPVVTFIRKKLADGFQELGPTPEKTIFDRIGVHTKEKPNMHNIVITGDRIVIARLHVRHFLVDFLLAKHVLVSGYDPNVRFAGEIWKGEDGKIYINQNSGTYRPSLEQLNKAGEYLQAVFPNLPIEVAPVQF